MSEYWPDDLDLTDTRSPLEILESVRQELIAMSGHRLTLDVIGTETGDGRVSIPVYAREMSAFRAAMLLEVTHRAGFHYPARIIPVTEELPDFLKKEYWKPGAVRDFGLSPALRSMEVFGTQVTNEWVCDTPTEFSDKLQQVLKRAEVKRALLGLLTPQSAAT